MFLFYEVKRCRPVLRIFGSIYLDKLRIYKELLFKGIRSRYRDILIRPTLLTLSIKQVKILDRVQLLVSIPLGQFSSQQTKLNEYPRRGHDSPTPAKHRGTVYVTSHAELTVQISGKPPCTNMHHNL
jgi:hypothetical protein